MAEIDMKNQQIEGLRGIGVLMVVLFHYLYRFQELYGNAEAVTFFSQWGTIGVGLFFSLSGYYMFHRKEIHQGGLLKFYHHRLKRLYTPYLIAILCIFAVTNIFGLPGRTPSIGELIWNVFFINGFIGVGYVDAAHWYLTYLILFTFISGIIMRARIKLVVAIPLWIVFAHILRYPIGRMYLPGAIASLLQTLSGGGSLYLFLIGVILHEINELKDKKDIRMLTAFFLYGVFCFWKLLRIYSPSAVIGCAVFAGIIELCVYNRLNCLSARWLTYLGTISYHWYLIHQNIGYVILLGMKGKAMFGITVMVAILSTLILSVLLYRVDCSIKDKEWMKCLSKQK